MRKKDEILSASKEKVQRIYKTYFQDLLNQGDSRNGEGMDHTENLDPKGS